jgi:AraC-like DNA-binding protein
VVEWFAVDHPLTGSPIRSGEISLKPHCHAAEAVPPPFTWVAEASLRMAPLLPLPSLIEDLGFTAERLIAAAGVEPWRFGHPDNSISFSDAGRLLAHCAEQTGCADLGLRIGRCGGLSVLGEVGHLVRYAPDLGSALRTLILYLHLHDQGAVPTLWDDGDTVAVGYVLYLPDVPAVNQIYDAALAITYNLLSELAGPGWQAREVWLHRPPPADPRPYREHFRNRVRFGAERAVVRFGSEWLRHPIASADDQRYRQLLGAAGQADAASSPGLAGRVRRVLRRLVASGAGLQGTSLGEVAKLFAVHRRTLNRRLREDGTSFKALLDAIRYEFARQLLRDTPMSTIEVALNLGYSELGPFLRAFRRWSGTSPAAWRAEHRTL